MSDITTTTKSWPTVDGCKFTAPCFLKINYRGGTETRFPWTNQSIVITLPPVLWLATSHSDSFLSVLLHRPSIVSAFLLVFLINFIIIIKLDLSIVKSGTAAPFAGVYIHEDKTNSLILKTTILSYKMVFSANPRWCLLHSHHVSKPSLFYRYRFSRLCNVSRVRGV